MASVRNDVDFEGILLETATFFYDSSIVFDADEPGGSAQVDFAVSVTDEKTVGLVGDAEDVHGKLLKVEGDGCCTVQIGGGCRLPGGTGATLTPGSKIVGDLGGAGGAVKGYIRSVAPATLAEVAVARHSIYDATEATEVQVMLGR